MSPEIRERKKEKEMPFIVATYISACTPKAAHALRSDQLNNKHDKLKVPIIDTFYSFFSTG